MSIRGLGNNSNRFDISSSKKAGAAGKAAGAGAAAGAAGAAAAGAAGSAAKNEDVLKLSAVAGQAGDAPQVSLGSAGPLPKTMHTDALAKAGKQLTPENRQEKSCQYIADKLFQEFESMFKAS